MRLRILPTSRKRKSKKEINQRAKRNPLLVLADNRAAVKKVARNNKRRKRTMVKFVSGGILKRIKVQPAHKKRLIRKVGRKFFLLRLKSRFANLADFGDWWPSSGFIFRLGRFNDKIYLVNILVS